jgi:hypothetical protein
VLVAAGHSSKDALKLLSSASEQLAPAKHSSRWQKAQRQRVADGGMPGDDEDVWRLVAAQDADDAARRVLALWIRDRELFWRVFDGVGGLGLGSGGRAGPGPWGAGGACWMGGGGGSWGGGVRARALGRRGAGLLAAGRGAGPAASLLAEALRRRRGAAGRPAIRSWGLRQSQPSARAPPRRSLRCRRQTPCHPPRTHLSHLYPPHRLIAPRDDPSPPFLQVLGGRRRDPVKALRRVLGAAGHSSKDALKLLSSASEQMRARSLG